MSNIKIIKDNNLLRFGSITRNIYNNQGESLDNIIRLYKLDVQATTQKDKIASINDTNIYIPDIEELPFSIQGLIWFNTFKDLKDYGSLYLKHGDFVGTKGYYTPNDGGGAFYNILNSPTEKINGMPLETTKQSSYGGVYVSPRADGYSLINIGTEEIPLYADLQLLDGRMINIRQLGARPLEDGVMIDNYEYFQAAMNFIHRKKFTTRIFIPAGHWCTSPVTIINTKDRYVAPALLGEGMNISILMPYNNSQTWIIRMGDNVNASSCSRGSTVYDISFLAGNAGLSLNLKQIYGEDKFLTDAALKMYGTYYDVIDNIDFKYIYNTCLRRIYSFEAASRNIRFHCCGGTRNGTTYPVTVWDDASITGASSISANWTPFMHFDSCIGSYINGASENNFTHNEFGTIVVTGSSEKYYQACPDKNIIDEIPSYSTDNLIRWGIFSGSWGSGSNWPNMYITIMCNSLDNWATRSVGGNTYYYRMSGIYTRINKDNISVKLSSGDTSTNSSSTNVYFGNICMPDILNRYTGGPYIGYNNSLDSKGSAIRIKLLFRKNEVPIYSRGKYPVIQIPGCDTRFLFNNELDVSYNIASSGSETPYSVVSSTPVNGSYCRFLAKAGTLYGLRYRGTGNFISSYNSAYHQGGLMIYKDNLWQAICNISASPIGSIDYNSSVSYKYINLPPIYFSEDTLIKVGGGNIDFFYERLLFPFYDSKKFECLQSFTPYKESEAKYSVELYGNYTSFSIDNISSLYFNTLIDGNTITIQPKAHNIFQIPKCAVVIVSIKNSDNDIVLKGAILASQPSFMLTIPTSLTVNLTDEYIYIDPYYTYNNEAVQDVGISRLSCSWSIEETDKQRIKDKVLTATIDNTSTSSYRGRIKLLLTGIVIVNCTYNGRKVLCRLNII